ncbi:MAG: hypothetical protein ACLQSX_07995 [Smithella sp.]
MSDGKIRGQIVSPESAVLFIMALSGFHGVNRQNEFKTDHMNSHGSKTKELVDFFNCRFIVE